MPESPHIDFRAMARRAEQMGQDVTDARTQIEAMEATGYGGDGLVRATVTGHGRLVALDIDPSVIDPDDPRTLSEMVVAAMDDAMETMTAQRTERLSQVMGGLAELIDQLHQVRPQPGTVTPRTPNRRPGSRPSRYPIPPDWPATLPARPQ
jgi:DNA-binding YbaB/EbfC family protein